MFLVQYKHGRTGPFIDEWQVSFTSQRHLENIDRIIASRPTRLRRQDDQVATRGFVLQAASKLGKRHLFTYGMDYYLDGVSSKRNDLNLVTGTTTVERSTFADGASFRSAAGFIQDEIWINPDVAVNLRARYSQFDLHAATTDTATGVVSTNAAPRALTMGAYISWRLRPELFLVGGVGEGFRAPNVDDVSILGSFSGGFEVPNPELQPEQANNYETGLKYRGKRFGGTASVYVSRFQGLIDRAPGTYLGLPYLDLNGNRIRDAGEEAIFQRTNVGQARIAGTELEGNLKLNDSWSAWANASWIRGVDTIRRAPLTRIPPAKGEVGLRWQTRRRIWVEPWLFYAWRQTRLSSADRTDPRIARGGTPGFALAGARAGVSLGEVGVLTVNFGNLTNKAYRQHGSGIDGPGRGIDIGLSRSF